MPEKIIEPIDRAGCTAEKLHFLLDAIAELADMDGKINLCDLHTIECAPAVWELVRNHDTAAGLLMIALDTIHGIEQQLDAIAAAVKNHPPRKTSKYVLFCTERRCAA